MAISKVNRIAPFDPRTKFIENTDPKTYGSGVSDSHSKWLIEVAKQINTSPEIVAVPATVTSTGNPGQVALTDPGFLWVCVAANTWKKIAWS